MVGYQPVFYLSCDVKILDQHCGLWNCVKAVNRGILVPRYYRRRVFYYSRKNISKKTSKFKFNQFNHHSKRPECSSQSASNAQQPSKSARNNKESKRRINWKEWRSWTICRFEWNTDKDRYLFWTWVFFETSTRYFCIKHFTVSKGVRAIWVARFY